MACLLPTFHRHRVCHWISHHAPGGARRFWQTLPPFAYRGELIYPDLEREQAAYEYVMQRGEQVHALHVAMNSLVNPGADFFLATHIA
jgi:hypothetical protein